MHGHVLSKRQPRIIPQVPQRQVGYVVTGKLKPKIGNEDTGIIQSGDSYLVRGSMSHSFEALEKSVVVDVFSSPREEYRNQIAE